MSLDELTNKSKCLVDFQGLGGKLVRHSCFIHIILVNFIKVTFRLYCFCSQVPCCSKKKCSIQCLIVNQL